MKKFKVGLQLYSIREEMEKDMDAALKRVKEIGYDYVEFAGFFEHSAEEIKSMLDKYGLVAISAHQGLDPFREKGQAAVDDLVTIGAKYCAIPWYSADRHKGTEFWEETVESFTEYSNALKKSGIKLLYHNHEYEFAKYEDKYLLDWLYEELPQDVIQPQLDSCWVHYAGVEPCGYIRKYSGRMDVLHLKDFVCKNLGGGPVYELIGDTNNTDKSAREDNGFEFRPLGQGLQDFPKILDAAEEAGVEYVIVEQDNSYDTPQLEAARISREYLKSLGL